MDARLGGDWSLYDADNDGVLDNVIALHSGYAAEESGSDCTNGRAYQDRIWSHAFADAGAWTSSNGQYTLRGYMTSSGLDLLCDSNPAKMGVMVSYLSGRTGLDWTGLDLETLCMRMYSRYISSCAQLFLCSITDARVPSYLLFD